jgi:4'-phosphopantetheinyl transferase
MSSSAPSNRPSLAWPTAAPPGTIARGEVHLWAWSFAERESPRQEDLRLLDDGERARTARFRFVPDRVRYSVCHAQMRRVLASYLERSPESLVFREGPGGKPELVSSPGGGPGERVLRFNLSHSKSVGVLAVALEMKIGIDVEDIRPIEPGVAERYFSTAELAGMRPLEGQKWLDAFYRCWTRKEAILKAEGVGLRIPLDSFDVSTGADEPAALLAARPEAKFTADWHLHHLAVAEGVVGALAVPRGGIRLAEHALVFTEAGAPPGDQL